MLHPQYASDTEYVERFRREARAVATLAHPNVAVVIDRGEDDGRPYIVFEYVEGGNLKTLIEREAPLPLERVIELGLQIARGLEHAHRSSLVHRDVKPQNVLLDRTGQAKLIDFGIARSSAEVRPGLTLTGTVLGSSDYIAPEQAQGRSVEERTDVYSLRDRALRDAHGRASVPRRELRRRRDAAHQRDATVGPRASPRCARPAWRG